MPTIDPLCRVLPVLIAAVLTGACVIPPPPPPDAWDAVHEETFPAPDILPLTRQGRYTLVELAPETAQRDLMRQLVE
ncbi:MAG: hypothetical protein LBU46_00200, partial [Candidatus Accumulibacter sp.]|nr:hypothetical protein [Accumulibacter sp.]